MKLLQLSYSNLTSFLRRNIEQLAKQHLTTKHKRLIFISSIVALIRHIDRADEELVSSMNEILSLSGNVKTCQATMSVKNMIWSDLKDSTEIITSTGRVIHLYDLQHAVLSEPDCLSICNFFNERMPDWLRYGSSNLIIRDVRKVLANVEKFKTA